MIWLPFLSFLLVFNISVNGQIQSLFEYRNGPCTVRPPACVLNCAQGFVWGLANSCLCLCQTDPCIHKMCPIGEVCKSQAGFAVCMRPAPDVTILRPSPRPPTSIIRSTTIGECPRLVGGSCLTKCQTDSDCSLDSKCCSNGCGFECTRPVNVAPIQGSLSIRPIGQLPQIPNFLQPTITPSINSNSAVPPNSPKGTCVHLLSAVQHLPSKKLQAGYLPKCTANGKFAPVQCDQDFCWCVQIDTGYEIWGTKVEIDERANLNCAEPRKCEISLSECERKSKNHCSFGWQTDSRGCPSSRCECRNLCDEIECNRKFHECQLIEPDCAEPPCQPVPKCILNPCPNGLPATLNNGVTALCTHNNPCFPGFWCHEIGYNKLGFCCPEPESARRLNSVCEARAPKRLSFINDASTDESECRVDADCPQPEKCCFDGVNLKCSEGRPSGGESSSATRRPTIVSGIFAENKALLSQLDAECPSFGKHKGALTCETECQNDDDCHGLRRCCKNGCSKICVYPVKTTACLHDAITFDLFGLKHAPRCNSQGDYHEIQCDSERCYCAEPSQGQPIPGSLVPVGQKPLCSRHRPCSQYDCGTRACAHGFKFDENGCPTCECKKPCSGIECPFNSVCTMVKVECTGESECKEQPRCVPNVCQGQPATNFYDLVEQCSYECPLGFSCIQFGLPGPGGLCCPLGISSHGGVRPTSHRGQCPNISIQVSRNVGPVRCRADADCAQHEKCCFDGQGTICTVIDNALQKSTKSVDLKNGHKPGECRTIDEHRQDCRSGVDECKEDNDCAGVLKCCNDGCYRKCLPAFKTTPCHHLKSALEPFGKSIQIRCSLNGEFEPTQCNVESCWCVDIESGREIEGTRVTGSSKPDCRMRRVCPERQCYLKCPNGQRKDSTGCPICDCINPCQDLKCPSSDHICTVQSVSCLPGVDCPQVPRCIPNVCRSGHPLTESTSGLVQECSSNGDCPRGAYCRRFGWKNGYCCGGPDNQHNSEKCPKITEFPLYSSSCSMRCRQDTDCGRSGDACCFNGCGMECTLLDQSKSGQTSIIPISSHSSDQHVQHQPAIESTCPHVQDLGHSVCGQARDNKCESDKECPGSLKCCFDGCSKSCVPPATASNCLHANAAVQALMRLGNANLFQPTCTFDGLFARVQRWRDMEWCVDSNTGHELPGTRNAGIANCDQPRSCRDLTCQLQCEVGYQIDDDGCEQCACRDPCHEISCPTNHVCRMTKMECPSGDDGCQPQPKCLLNVCLRGEPLSKANTKLLIQCDNQRKQHCPPGWFCNQFGLSDGGYCCAGIVSDSQLYLSASRCTPTPVLYSKDEVRSRSIECRLQKDCDANGVKPCCFDGYGTRCMGSVGRSSFPLDLPIQGHSQSVVANQPGNAVHPEGIKPIKPILNQADRGTCPTNIFHNPGCQTECHVDGECAEFSKCCEFGCGRKCLYPDLSFSCVHRLSVLDEEQSKLRRSNKLSSRAPDWKNTTTVQCASNGQYRGTQCQRSIGQCWCVNPVDGKEIIGTRASMASRGEPNCLAPKKCSVDCRREWEECEHGVRLDPDGCPASGRCECRNPCERFECALKDEICVLRSVQCPQEPCPKQPTCRPSPCAGNFVPVRSKYSIAQTCRRESECIAGGSTQEVECRALATTNDEDGHKVGICCDSPSSVNVITTGNSALGQPMHTFDGSVPQKDGICPLKKTTEHSSQCVAKCSSDADCHGTSKCCRYGCSSSCEQPAPATNCMHMMVAIEKLKNDGVSSKLPVPACDHETGTYVDNQCDEDGSCWCVDITSGAELTATRHSQPTFNVCKAEHRRCPIECGDDLVESCPFGLDLDASGCPKTSQCRCKNPCDLTDCPDGEACLLRSRVCVEAMCLPVPQCEPNPCSDNQRPLLEARGFSQFACFHNRTRPCPVHYQCTGFDQREIGVCCPPPLSSSHFHQDADQNEKDRFLACPHGPSYSVDDQPTICSLSGQNTCPSTHFCVTKPGQTHGTCCPTKRFVCNLEKDIATTCNKPINRFYFDPESQSCIPFVYGGCEGNLNNFETETACQQFCVGVGSDPLSRFFNGGEEDEKLSETNDLVYTVGFSLTGPLTRQKHTQEFNERLRDYLMATYSLSEDELKDLYVKDDNTVRFNLIAPDAQQKTLNISQAVASGHFRFRYGDESYHAEPQTWFSQQIDTNVRPAVSGALFWILLVASTLFALAVVFVLWCACSFVRSRSKDNSSIFRGVSPNPFGQISAYISDGRSSSASSSHISRPTGNSNKRQQRQKTISADDLRILQQMERENRQMASTSGAIAQFLANPLQQPKRIIQKPRIVDSNGLVNGRNQQKRPPINKSTVFY